MQFVMQQRAERLQLKFRSRSAAEHLRNEATRLSDEITESGSCRDVNEVLVAVSRAPELVRLIQKNLLEQRLHGTDFATKSNKATVCDTELGPVSEQSKSSRSSKATQWVSRLSNQRNKGPHVNSEACSFSRHLLKLAHFGICALDSTDSRQWTHQDYHSSLPSRSETCSQDTWAVSLLSPPFMVCVHP